MPTLSPSPSPSTSTAAMAAVIKFPCPYQRFGCKEFMDKEAQHIRVCEFRTLLCELILPKSNFICGKEVPFNGYLQHVFSDHLVVAYQGIPIMQLFPMLFLSPVTVVETKHLSTYIHATYRNLSYLVCSGIDPKFGELCWWVYVFCSNPSNLPIALVKLALRHPNSGTQISWQGKAQNIIKTPTEIMDNGNCLIIPRRLFQTLVDFNEQTSCSEWMVDLSFVDKLQHNFNANRPNGIGGQYFAQQTTLLGENTPATTPTFDSYVSSDGQTNNNTSNSNIDLLTRTGSFPSLPFNPSVEVVPNFPEPSYSGLLPYPIYTHAHTSQTQPRPLMCITTPLFPQTVPETNNVNIAPAITGYNVVAARNPPAVTMPKDVPGQRCTVHIYCEANFVHGAGICIVRPIGSTSVYYTFGPIKHNVNLERSDPGPEIKCQVQNAIKATTLFEPIIMPGSRVIIRCRTDLSTSTYGDGASGSGDGLPPSNADVLLEPFHLHVNTISQNMATDFFTEIASMDDTVTKATLYLLANDMNDCMARLEQTGLKEGKISLLPPINPPLAQQQQSKIQVQSSSSTKQQQPVASTSNSSFKSVPKRTTNDVPPPVIPPPTMKKSPKPNIIQIYLEANESVGCGICMIGKQEENPLYYYTFGPQEIKSISHRPDINKTINNQFLNAQKIVSAFKTKMVPGSKVYLRCSLDLSSNGPNGDEIEAKILEVNIDFIKKCSKEGKGGDVKFVIETGTYSHQGTIAAMQLLANHRTECYATIESMGRGYNGKGIKRINDQCVLACAS